MTPEQIAADVARPMIITADMIRRPLRTEGNITFIPLTRGLEAMIDTADIDFAAGKDWFAYHKNGAFYACTNIINAEGKRRPIFLHRLIIPTQGGLVVDHVNGNGLDNRRANLRVATHTENMRNCRRSKANTSGVKGVHWHKGTQKWKAEIRTDEGRKHLGLFRCVTAGALAYAKASAQFHGDFGRTL